MSHLPVPAWLLITLYLLFINAVALMAYMLDKHRAAYGGWRISERTLLTIAFLGGSPGSLFAQKWLRHKTRKQPFQGVFRMIVVLQFLGVLVVAVIIWL